MKGSEMALVFLKPQNRHNTARALYSDIDTEENKQTGRGRAVQISASDCVDVQTTYDPTVDICFKNK